MFFDYLYFKIISENHILNVSLKNPARKWYGDFQGIYVLSKNKVNGKPSWQSETHGIWSYPHRMDRWVVGNLTDMGGSFEFQEIQGERGNLL